MKISIIGTGNVAWHLATMIDASPALRLVQIVGRKENSFSPWFDSFQVSKTTGLNHIDPSCDLYILSVKDDDIDTLVDQFPFRLESNQLIVHTSGTKDIAVLSTTSNHYGCLWPIQSLTKGQSLIEIKIPIGVTGNNVESHEKLLIIARLLSERVIAISESQKPKYHLASILTNNLVNHLVFQAQSYCASNELSFDQLSPLLQYTIEKLQVSTAYDAQTGPARRHDQSTIDKHLSMLTDLPTLLNIYQLLSTSISTTYPKENSNNITTKTLK